MTLATATGEKHTQTRQASNSPGELEKDAQGCQDDDTTVRQGGYKPQPHRLACRTHAMSNLILTIQAKTDNYRLSRTVGEHGCRHAHSEVQQHVHDQSVHKRPGNPLVQQGFVEV